MIPIYTTLPAKFCEYALVNRKVNHLCLYLYLKHTSSGHVKYSSANYKIWAIDLNKSEKWIKSAVKWLIKEKWITVNRKKKSYRIISYAQLSRKLNINPKSAVIFETNDFSNFRKFCCAVVITYHLNRKRWMERKRRSVSIMGDTSLSRYRFPKGFHDLPIRYFAKVLNVSNSTANNIKNEAKKSGFVVCRSRISTLFDKKGRKIAKEHFKGLRKENLAFSGRLRVGKKYLKIVESDIFSSEIPTKRKLFKFKEKM